MEVVNVRLSKNIIVSIEKLSKKHGLSKSEIIRQALIIYLHIVENVGSLLRPIAFHVKPSQISYLRKGDVTILRIPTGHSIVVGSTSSGAIGSKEMDKLKVEGPLLGKFLARVALMDVASTGASPLLLSLTLGVEKEPTGQKIMEGIRKEILVLGLDPNQVLMENTEENFETQQTGVGLTVIGIANEPDLRLGKSVPGDLLVAIGKPVVGNKVLPAEARDEIADLRIVSLLSQKKYVHDIVPVGSLGILHEAQRLSHSVGRALKLVKNHKIDLEKSAGPATVLLATVDRKKLDELYCLFRQPINIIGELM